MMSSSAIERKSSKAIPTVIDHAHIELLKLCESNNTAYTDAANQIRHLLQTVRSISDHNEQCRQIYACQRLYTFMEQCKATYEEIKQAWLTQDIKVRPDSNIPQEELRGIFLPKFFPEQYLQANIEDEYSRICNRTRATNLLTSEQEINQALQMLSKYPDSPIATKILEISKCGPEETMDATRSQLFAELVAQTELLTQQDDVDLPEELVKNIIILLNNPDSFLFKQTRIDNNYLEYFATYQAHRDLLTHHVREYNRLVENIQAQIQSLDKMIAQDDALIDERLIEDVERKIRACNKTDSQVIIWQQQIELYKEFNYKKQAQANRQSRLQLARTILKQHINEIAQKNIAITDELKKIDNPDKFNEYIDAITELSAQLDDYSNKYLRTAYRLNKDPQKIATDQERMASLKQKIDANRAFAEKRRQQMLENAQVFELSNYITEFNSILADISQNRFLSGLTSNNDDNDDDDIYIDNKIHMLDRINFAINEINYIPPALHDPFSEIIARIPAIRNALRQYQGTMLNLADMPQHLLQESSDYLKREVMPLIKRQLEEAQNNIKVSRFDNMRATATTWLRHIIDRNRNGWKRVADSILRILRRVGFAYSPDQLHKTQLQGCINKLNELSSKNTVYHADIDTIKANMTRINIEINPDIEFILNNSYKTTCNNLCNINQDIASARNNLRTAIGENGVSFSRPAGPYILQTEEEIITNDIETAASAASTPLCP